MKMQALESESSRSASRLLPHVFAALYYIAASTSLTIFNKLLFNTFAAVDPLLLLLFQAFTTLSIFAALTVARRFRLPTLPTDRNVVLAYIPLLLSYAVMLTTSLIALRFTSLLMYNTIRRTSLLFVVVLHSWSTKSYPARYTVTATGLTLAGALFASMTDLSFDPFGYSLAILANASTAIFLVLLRPVRDRLNYTNMQLLFFNTLCITPLLLCLLFIMPPHDSILPLFSASSTFCILFALSCALAVVITHATYVNTTVNDAITQTVSAQVKDVLLLSASYFFVDSAAGRGKGNLVGVAIGFCGSVIYGFGKLHESRSETTSGNPLVAPETGASNLKYERITEDEAQS
jgi:solute carrier family 35